MYKHNLLSQEAINTQRKRILVTISGMDEYKDLQVVGFLVSEFGFNLESKWENMPFQPSGIGEYIDTLEQIRGTAAFQTGVYSKLFYKGGNYLNLTLTIRVIDYNGSNNVRNATLGLMKMTSPIPTADQLAQLKLTETAKDAFDSLKVAAGGALDVAMALVTGNVKQVGKATEDTLSSIASLMSKGGMPQVYVKVGHECEYFSAPMIIESIKTEYSNELTETGPLYADFIIQLSSLQVWDKNKIQQVFSGKNAKYEDLNGSIPESKKYKSGSNQITKAPSAAVIDGERLTNSKRGNEVVQPTIYDAQITAAANKYGLDPKELKALLWTESKCNPNARSGTGAVGIAQITGQTADEINKKYPGGFSREDRLNPVKSIDAAAYYYKKYCKPAAAARNPNDPYLAAAAYNQGPGAIRSGRTLTEEANNERLLVRQFALQQG